MKIETFNFVMTFTTPTLATSPGNKEVFERFIASKSADSAKIEEEMACTPSAENIGMASTVFPRDKNGLFAWDYQLRGMVKEGVGALIELGECPLSKWVYKRAVDQYVHVLDRKNYYRRPDGGNVMVPDGDLERPLRCDTMQGPRVALARSERIDEDIQLFVRMEMELPTKALKRTPAIIDSEMLTLVLNRGQRIGFSQWRSGGWGRFTWRRIDPNTWP